MPTHEIAFCEFGRTKNWRGLAVRATICNVTLPIDL